MVSDFSRAFGNNVVREVGIPPARPPTRVRWLTRAQVELIIRETRDEPLLAFVAFLGLAQGLRRIEWQRLLIEDIDLEGRRLLIRGKGRGRPRLQWVALHPSFAEVYGRYAEVRLHLVDAAGRDHPRAPVPAEVLVCATPSGLSPYTLSGLDCVVRRIQGRLARAGVHVALSTHMLRRSGATLLEESLLGSPGISPDGVYRVVQRFLRHDNLATTMGYLESNPGRLARALELFARAGPWSGSTGGAHPGTAPDPTPIPTPARVPAPSGRLNDLHRGLPGMARSARKRPVRRLRTVDP